MKGIIINFEEGKTYRSLHNGRYYKYENKCFFEKNEHGKWSLAGISVDFAANTEFKEVEREIDWNKVPRNTLVRVRNSEKYMWEDRLFIYYDINSFPFVTTTDDECGVHCWKYCEIIGEIKEEWYKEV